MDLTGTNGFQAPDIGSVSNFFFVYATILDAALPAVQKMREPNNSERASGAGARQSAKKCTFGELAPGVGCVSNFFFAHVKMSQRSGLRVPKNRESDMY